MADPRAQPLSGLRVLDMADERGELCGRIMADLGADVIRAEPPGGAVSRTLPPFAPDGATSLYFAFRNAGKRGLTLDVTRPGGRELLHRLLERADIWIESIAPRRLAEWRLEPAETLARHPALVITSITDFGHSGPYRDYEGTDMIGFALGGLMHRAGAATRPPVVAPGALAYDAAGVTGAYAALMAYWKRLRSGRGQHVDVSVLESAANLSDWALPGFSLLQQRGKRDGAGIYPLYRCADGWVRMIIIGPHHWRALLAWMGQPEQLADPAFEQFIARVLRRAEIDPVISDFLREQKKVDVAREAQARGIPVTPLLTPGEVLSNEHTEARGTFRSLEVLPGLEGSFASGFYEIDGERAGPRQRAPLPGEHDREIRDELDRQRVVPRREEGTSAAGAGDGHPFRGLRVLDFGIGAVGVEVGRLLAEYGAEVVKIESQQAPDFMRIVLPGGMNPMFASSSRSKRSLGINLKTRPGLELVHRLVRISDVVIENNGAGVMERLGLGYEALREINPRIVMFSSHLPGSRGPWKDWIGYGPSTHPVSGLQYLWNYPEDEQQPAGSTNVHPDHFVGRLGALGVVAGLISRERTGRGLHAEAAQFEASIQLLGDLMLQESLAPGSVHPQGNASARGAPWGCYPCAGEDEWCVINVRSDAEWEALRAALDDPSWSARGEYRTASGRVWHRDPIDRALAAWTAERTPREVMERLQAHGVPAAIVAHPEHQLADPHLQARGYLRPLEQPPLGRIVLEGPAFRGSDLPDPIIRPAPLLGEHTREVCAELLELSAQEIDRLISEGVLEVPAPAS